MKCVANRRHSRGSAWSEESRGIALPGELGGGTGCLDNREFAPVGGIGGGFHGLFMVP